MKDLLLFPQFGIDEDEQAYDQIKQVFPEYQARGAIETINVKSL